MNAHNEQHFTAADMADQYATAFERGRESVLAERAAAAQEAVAYLDIGAGGYLDLGSDLPDERLLSLPKGRHALGIIGTYGIDGYVTAPVTAAPVVGATLTNPYTGQPRDYRDVESDPAGTLIVNPKEPLFANNSSKQAWWNGYRAGKGLPPDTPRSVAASTPAASGIDRAPTPVGWSDTDFIALGNPIDLRIFRKAVLRWKLFSELGVDIESMPMHFRKSPEKYAEDVIEANRLLALIDASPKGDSEARDAALNTLAIMFHNSEEMEGPDGMAVSIDLALWHEALEAYEVLIDGYDEVTLATSAQAQASDAEVRP